MGKFFSFSQKIHPFENKSKSPHKLIRSSSITHKKRKISFTKFNKQPQIKVIDQTNYKKKKTETKFVYFQSK